MRREPTEEELDRIAQSLRQRDRIAATSLYISITQAGLTEAQNFIKKFSAQMADGDGGSIAVGPQTPVNRLAKVLRGGRR